MPDRFIVTNFAYGTGPYLRTTDLAIAFNDELQKAGRPRLGIIVPLVYGEKQKRIMAEQFPLEEIIFDEKLGSILKSVFYDGNTYEEALGVWVKDFVAASMEARKYLSATYGDRIAVELNRSPRLIYGVAPAYFTSFAYVGEILERALDVKAIATDKDLVRQGIAVADRIESAQRMRCIAYPATFSYKKDYRPRYPGEILVPPIAPPPQPCNDRVEPGVFVTVTGISGLERLYGDAKRLGVGLYSNSPDAVPGSTKASPRIISSKDILFQLARAGWSSVWASMISGTPLVAPDFDHHDDPEIYFNNLAVEELGIGIIYRGQSLEEIFQESGKVKKAGEKISQEVLSRWGTLDGNSYAAKLFVEDFLQISR